MLMSSKFYQDAIVFFVGSVSVLTTGVQPIILGGLAHDGRLSIDQIGLSAMVELLALGLSCGFAAAKLNPANVRLIVLLATLAHAAVTATCTSVSGIPMVALRGLAGITEGIMLWMTICMIVRTRNAARYAGIFAIVQTLGQAGMAAFLSSVVMPPLGTNGAFMTLSIVSFFCAFLALSGPKAYAPLVKPSRTHDRPVRFLPYLGLVSVFLYNAFIVGLWVYLEPLAAMSGLSPQAAGQVIAVSLAAQVAGGLVGTLIAHRMATIGTILAAGLSNICLASLFYLTPSAVFFIGYALLFGFLWMFVMPFHTQLLIDVDPSRRIAMQLGTSQLLGASFGPLVASLCVGDAVNQSLPVVGVMMIGSLLLIGVLRLNYSTVNNKSCEVSQ